MHEFTKYFKDRPGFARFIKALYEKYQSFSKFSGTVKLFCLSSEEASAFSRFFGQTYLEGENITVPIKKFLKVMENSRYEDFDIAILVEEYLNVSLVTKKEQKDLYEEEKEKFFKALIIDDSLGCSWLSDVVSSKKSPYIVIEKRYHKNKQALKKELFYIIELINHLPDEMTLLPIYASAYTKDPHYLDLDHAHSVLFFYALSDIVKVEYPKSRAEKISLLSKYHIEIDTLSNYVITYQLLSDKEYMNEFSKQNETLILNIQNIMNTKYFDTKDKKVFIFENPSILTEILAKNLRVSVIISGGFPNTSVYLLLDELIKTGNQLYYNGDFDPEGLLIAQKLKEKYPTLKLICYDEIDYQNCISKKKISSARLQKLAKVISLELLEIKELLLSHNYSAYQENNKERLIDFIERCMEKEVQ